MRGGVCQCELLDLLFGRKLVVELLVGLLGTEYERVSFSRWTDKSKDFIDFNIHSKLVRSLEVIVQNM